MFLEGYTLKVNQHRFVTLILLLFLLIMCQSRYAIAATSHGSPSKAGLDLAMKNFVKAVETGDTTLFLSFVSKSSGVNEVNTIDSSHLSNLDTLQYAKLANDFKIKGFNYYREFFRPGDVHSENEDVIFFDIIKAVKQGRWLNIGHDTFVPALVHPFLGRRGLYIRWQKNGSHWMLKEIGRPES